MALTLCNAGTAAVQMQVYDRLSGQPAQRVDVPAEGSAPAEVVAPSAYDIAVHGPNGFLRAIIGTAGAARLEVAATVIGSSRRLGLKLEFANSTGRAADATRRAVCPRRGVTPRA